MYIKHKRIIRYVIAIFLLLAVVDVIAFENFRRITDPYNYDENNFKNVTQNFNVEYIRYLEYNTLETKPLTFLTLQKVLNNADPPYTRGFNLILIIICTFLIYKITSSRLSIFFILIPIILDSMWLTVEIIEVTFILLSIRYAHRSGIFTGLATIFRPTALLYSFLLNKKQIWWILAIGAAYSLLLLYLGLFFSYLYEVTHYAKTIFVPPDVFVALIFIMFIIIGLNRKMIGYVVISAVPLVMKLYPHYFLPVFTFLFIGFLLNLNEDPKKIN